MKSILRFTAVLFFAACLIQTAVAASVDYTMTELGGSRYQYNYTISNAADSTYDISAFDIYFDYRLYDNLVLVSAPADWLADTLVWSPEWIDFLNFGIDGQLSALSSTTFILPGESLSGFSVSFDWLGQDVPGNQFFDISNPVNWSVMDRGYTNYNDTPEVPEPQTLMLLGTGLVGLLAYYRRNNARK